LRLHTQLVAQEYLLDVDFECIAEIMGTAWQPNCCGSCSAFRMEGFWGTVAAVSF